VRAVAGGRAAEARAPVPGPVPEPGAHDDEVVRRALDRLPPTQRAVLALRVWEGLGPSEIAARLGLRPGAVRMNLLYARRTLAALLGPQE
jgi:RNA polymerase sigma-70 factor (ECF subfamily)